MAFLHYADSKIELTDDDVDRLIASGNTLSKPGFQTVQLDSGTVHFVTGPGIPLLIDERSSQTGARPSRR
jgi:hypothetical protein